MPADPRDDFEVLADREHLMFGLVDPYGLIRERVEAHLRSETPDTNVDAIVAYGEPKWMSIAHRDAASEGNSANSGTVTQFGFCTRMWIATATGYSREGFDATLTMVFGGWDDPDHHRRAEYLDLHADADVAFDDERFRQRFLAFRDDVA